MNAEESLKKILTYEFKTVLDIGSGTGEHAEIFKTAGKEVITISLEPPADIVGDFMTHHVPDVDCIWASHVLEHQVNPGTFLRRCYSVLNDNGVLAVTVPPLKNEIVGGHVTLWNAGLLLYQLILAGFDCSKAKVKTYGYNISVIVQKTPLTLPKLRMDYGDIEVLKDYFPFDAEHGFDGNIQELNW